MGRKRSHRPKRSAARSVRLPTVTGTVRLTDRGAYVDCAEGALRLTSRALREVMAGDVVAVSLTRGAHGERRAVVESVMSRASETVVGTFDAAGPLGVVRPLDTRLKVDFFVMPTDETPARLGVRPGDVVLGRIQSYPSRYESGVVITERRLGDADAPDLGIRCVMARYGLKDGYPERAEQEAAALTVDVDAALADPLRRDLRDRFVLTIDPVDARDFDDAISLVATADGGFRLGVHIADVSHYVPWGSSIDLEARRRGTSVYLADRVLPMLPEHLSNELCSLVPDCDRLAMTVDIALDAQGRVRRAVMYPSVIHSRVRLSYDQADALLQQAPVGDLRDGAGSAPVGVGTAPTWCGRGEVLSPSEDDGVQQTTAGRCAPHAIADEVPHGGAPLAEQVRKAQRAGVDLAAFLRLADELAAKRRAIRERRGAVDFETVEVHAVLNDAGEPVALTTRARSAATSLIEEAMLLANECVAERLVDAGVAAAFRVHESPRPDHVHDAAFTLLDLGICDRAQAEAMALGDQAAMREVLAASAGTGGAEAANALLLRAMQRAVYRPHNLGHYALGADAYCHFTSPIRRYPDLLVHRALKALLARERLARADARDRARRLVGEGKTSLDQLLPQLCRSSSDAERTADAAARASQKVEVARYYQTRIGERAWGSVVWADEMGAFARLDDTAAEGLVPLRQLGEGRFTFDRRLLTFSDLESGHVIRLGDRMIVEVAAVNPVRGHLNLKLIHHVSARRDTLH